MEFTLTQAYPAGLDRLWAAFGRGDYPRQKDLALGATAVRLARFAATAQAIEVELERDMPVDASRLPRWSRALAGSRQTLRQRTLWRRIGPTQATAELDISPIGMPVRAHGRAAIAELGPASTRLTLSWRVDCSVPVIGGSVERLFADQVRDALEADHAFTLKYLAAEACDAVRPPGEADRLLGQIEADRDRRAAEFEAIRRLQRDAGLDGKCVGGSAPRSRGHRSGSP